tara:strand:- start:1813 stop:2049 length:237 start_codon:yes stop_codon:yes gene_type:complete
MATLTKEQQAELDALVEEMTEDAKLMVDDYKKNPSNLSGSIDVDKGMVKGDGVVVHEDSPYLDDKPNIRFEQEDDGEI